MSLEGLPALLGADPTDPETVKACCATAYGHDLVALFLGDSYHPGGAELTRRLAQLMGLQPGDTVLDVASGPGTTAVQLAAEHRVDVIGIDLGPAQNAKAQAHAERLGLSDRVRFEIGDAERLPIDDASVGAVICECALCTFPDKTAAVDEMARVLRPGGRVGISDVWLDVAHLDPDLQGLAGRVACLADARTIPEIRALIDDAGFEVTHLERRDDALLATIDQIQTRLRALRIADLPLLRGFDLRRGIDLARRAADTVRHGHAGYMLLTATRP